MQLLKSIYRTWRKNLLNEIIVDDFRSWKGLHLQIASWHVRKKLEQTTKNEKVAILLPTSGLFPVALTAVWGSGRTAVPLNYLLSPEEIQYIIKDSGIDTVITATPMLDFIGTQWLGARSLLRCLALVSCPFSPSCSRRIKLR